MEKNYKLEKATKSSKKPSYPLNLESNYVAYNTEGSIQNHHFSSQGTTGETKYIQTEKKISPRLIHKERPKQKTKKTIENKLYDSNCTLNINIKVIQDLIKSTQLPNIKSQQMKALQNKIEIITKYIKDRESLQKEKEKEFSKKLLNTQIILEVKRRKEETLNVQKEAYEEYIDLAKKKDIMIRKCHKKFTEIQIYIRRESQNFLKYKRIYGNFSIDNFILENENMLRIKEKLNNIIKLKIMAKPVLLKEINIMKKNNNINDKNIILNNNDKNNEKLDTQKKLDIFILIGEDKLKIIENKNLQINQIYNKISYKYFKNYNNNVLKYYNLINNDFDFSKSQINIVSGINQQNSIDNNETNMSNLYFDIMNIGNNKSTFMVDDFSKILNSKFA